MPKSNDYWKKRFEAIEAASNAYGQDVYRQIEDTFIRTQKEIDDEITKWLVRTAKNNEITMVEAKKLLNAKELVELKWDVKQFIKYGQENALDHTWVKQLENASARFHINRLEALKLRIQQASEKAFGNELDEIDMMARKVYSDTLYHSSYEIHKGFNVGWDIATIDERKLDKLISKPWAADGKNFSNRIWQSKTAMVNDLHNELVRTCILGKSPDEAIKHMSQFVDKKFKNAKAQAGRLVMTEQAFFSSAAQQDCFDDLDVEEFEVVATLDSRTSETCQYMDGKHFPMKDFQAGVTAPPFHVWCRSATVPYFNDEWSVGERAARGEDGKTYYIPSNMTYPEWKKSFVDGGSKDGLNELHKKEFTFTVNTPEEAKVALVERVGFNEVESSFDKIDDRLQVDVTNQLLTLENKFGAIHKSTGTICSAYGGKGTEAYVSARSTNPSFQNLSLCPDYHADKDEVIKSLLRQKENGWSMPFSDDKASVYNVTHEYGHILQNILTRDRMIMKGWSDDKANAFIDFSKKTRKAMFKWYYDVEKEIGKECFKEIVNIAKEINSDFSINNNLSKYGSENYFEFFAETFANSQLGETNELGRAMQIWLKRKGLMLE